MSSEDEQNPDAIIGQSRKYKYIHATKHLDRWVSLYESGTLLDVYEIAREADQLLFDSDNHPAVRLAINNTIAMAVTKKRTWEIPTDSNSLFRTYNAGIRRLAVFEPDEIELACEAERSIGWQMMATLAKITARQERHKLLHRMVAGNLSHVKLLELVKSRMPKLKRPPIPGNVLKVANRALAESREQLEIVADPKFSERLHHVVNRDEFTASLESVGNRLRELPPLLEAARKRIEKMQRMMADEDIEED